MGGLHSVKLVQMHLWKLLLATGVFLICFVQLEGGKKALWSIVSRTALSQAPLSASQGIAGGPIPKMPAEIAGLVSGSKGVSSSGVDMEGQEKQQAYQKDGEEHIHSKEEDEEGTQTATLDGKAKEKDGSVHADTPSIQVLESEGGEDSKDGDRSLKETCNLYQGTWVKGEPLYSGTECSILAQQWACRKSKRADFGYENWRWRPTACDLPTFDADDFLERLRNKAVVFIGDSLGQQQFQSLLCLLSKGNMEQNAKQVNEKYDFRPPRFGPQRPPGMAYLFERTNTTVVIKGNAFLGDIVPNNASHPALGGVLHLGRPDTWLMRNFWWIDILVLNTGHHWGWSGLRAAKLVPSESNMDLNATAKIRVTDMQRRVVGRTLRYLNQAAERRQTKPLVYFRALSPRHFLDGEWDSGGRCDNIKDKFGVDDMAKRRTIDMIAEDAVRGMKNIRLLNITYLSQFRGEAHLSVWWLNYDAKSNVQDCLHWCLPGVPDTWNEILYANVILNDHKQKELDAENGN